MNLNEYLPRYKRTWSKINSLEPIHHETGGIYLVIKQNNPLIHNGEVSHKYLSQFQTIAIEGLYFFELFKYLKKYQDAIAPKEIGTAVNLKHYDADFGLIKHNIKDHLIKKYNKKLSKKLTLTMRFEHLSKYKKFIDYCFECLTGNQMEINLVIQKRIGYKYYQNIIYK